MWKWVLRYFRSPEFVLALANSAISIPLFASESIDTLVEKLFEFAIEPIASSLSQPWEDWLVIAIYLLMTAPLLFPLCTALLAGAISEVINITEWHPAFTLLAVPNAVVWGILVAFAYRLIRTGDLRKSRAAMFQWCLGRDIADQPLCPHCGRPMP